MIQEALQLISSPYSWALYFACAMLIGISKTGIQNIGTLAVPFFALLFGAKYSTGIVLILLCFADLIAVIYYRKAFLWKEVKSLLPLAFVGLFVGLILGNYIDDKTFKRSIAVCIIVAVAIMLWRGRACTDSGDKLTKRSGYSPSFASILGFSTMRPNAAGPALSLYMHSK